MRRHLTLSLASLLLAAPAPAAVLHSAPVLATFGNDMLLCHVQNISSVPLEVEIAALDFAGNVVDGGGSQTIPPGESRADFTNNGEPAASCRITVNGSAKSVRASAIYSDLDTNSFDIVLPVE